MLVGVRDREPKNQLLDSLREEQRRREARGSLLGFIEYTHHKWQTGAHHRKLCEALEAVLEGRIKRLMINMPPRTSKTETATRRFPAYVLGKYPDYQMICVSHTGNLARDNSVDIMKIMREREYRNLFPEVELDPNAQAAERWRTTAGGIVIAGGVDGNITGRGANILVIDDPVKGRNEAESPRMRELAWRFYMGDAIQRLMPGGAIIFCCTRWHEDDLAARALKTEDWHQIVMPAIANEGAENEEALWPEFWPLDVMREKRQVFVNGHRARDWQAQYQQNPTPDTGTYMQRAWFENTYEPHELPKELNYYIASDYAVAPEREGSDPDYTEFGVFGVGPDDTLYAVDWWSGRSTPDVWINAQLDLVAKYKPLAVFGEGGVIRRAIEPFLTKLQRERRIYSRNEWVTSTANKSIRGRAFQGRAAMGKVRFPANKDWAGRVVEQCIAFPSGVHDDAFDACALMCSVIDQSHPAIVPEQKIERTDRWRQRREARGDDELSWKVV